MTRNIQMHASIRKSGIILDFQTRERTTGTRHHNLIQCLNTIEQTFIVICRNDDSFGTDFQIITTGDRHLSVSYLLNENNIFPGYFFLPVNRTPQRTQLIH